MLGVETIDQWAEDNGLEIGEAMYVLLKYLADDPRIIGSSLRRLLREATEQEVRDAMETATDDINSVGKQKVLL